MKLLSKLARALCSSVVMAAITLPAAVSCSELNDLKNQFGELEDKYEDLNGKVDLIVDKLFELEEKLNNEIQALKDMLDGKVLISSVSTAALGYRIRDLEKTMASGKEPRKKVGSESEA